MRPRSFRTSSSLALVALLALALSTACGTAAAPPAIVVTAPELHHHELNLPPVGPNVKVTMNGKSLDVPLSSLVAQGTSVGLVALFQAAFPAEDPASLHFDFTGSDGFHPASRPPCAALLTGAQVAAAHIDVVSHNITYDDALPLPGCYRVKAVVVVDASR